MGKNKLQRFAEIAAFDNVLECTGFKSPEERPKGRWHEDIFKNSKPVTLELACGKAEYTLGLARLYSDRNFIGIDIKGARIWKGAKRALNEGLENVRFLRTYIDHLADYFAPAEVSQLWITFPDPYPRAGDRNKRLTSPKFLSVYQQVLEPGARIHFKTDSTSLFEYTLTSLQSCHCQLLDRVDDVYSERPEDELLTIQTYYEKRHLAAGKKIKYLSFSLPEKAIK